jgi:hypothetical protein
VIAKFDEKLRNDFLKQSLQNVKASTDNGPPKRYNHLATRPRTQAMRKGMC